MNCKPGDIAFVVSMFGTGKPAEIGKLAIGKVVKVVRHEKHDGMSDFRVTSEMLWKLEEPVVVQYEGDNWFIGAIADRNLRPLRDNEGDDQTLTWAGKPNEVTA